RAEAPVMDRREPTLDLPPRAMTVGSQRAFHVSPSYNYDPYVDQPVDDRALDGDVPTRSRRTEPRRQVRSFARERVREVGTEPDQEPVEEHGLDTASRSEEERSRAMAKRFAPERSEPAGGLGFGLFRRRGVAQDQASTARGKRRAAAPRPIWPGSVPVP